jgi:hypothetical protein
MNRYRVIVLREASASSEEETLFELTGSAVLVARLAPTALLDVLSADPEAQGEPAAAAAVTATGERSLADRVFDGAIAAGAVAEQAPASEPAKRTRRTKAQIAADNEAQAAGFRDAAHRAEVENGPQQQAAPVAPVVAPAADGPRDAVAPGPAPAPAAQADPSAPPWNPFVPN